MAIKWNIDLVKEYASQFGYEVLDDEYVNNSYRLNMICNEKHEVFMRFSDFRSGKRCNICGHVDAGKKKRHKIEFVSSTLRSFGYTLVSKNYEGINEKITFKDDFGYMYSRSFSIFLNCTKEDNRPSIVHVSNPYSDRNISLYMKEHSENLKYISMNYCNARKNNLEFLCSDCGKIFVTSWNNIFSRNSNCNCNKKSFGEKRIENFLLENDFIFIPQKRFHNCRRTFPLPFDFYLLEYNTCIEYQGQQHYGVLNDGFWGGKKEFEERQIRDGIKRSFCLNNNINLLEIPYWDFDNIEKILIKELNLGGL